MVGSWLIALMLALAASTAAAATARASGLPDGRAFELVSPPDTNGNSAYQVGGVTAIPSDDSVIWGGGNDSDGPSGSGVDPTYLASRQPSGWSSSSLLPAQINGGEVWYAEDATPSLSATVFSVGSSASLVNPVPPTQQVPSRLVYRDASGDFTTFSVIPASNTSAYMSYGGMSADGQTVVFSSLLTPSGATPADNLQTVYSWSPGGSAQPLGRDQADPLANCSEQVAAGVNSVSAAGSTVFLQSGSGPTGSNCPQNTQLYVSVNGQTQEVSVPTDGTPADPSADASDFYGATPDGTTAYFTSSSPLTVAAPPASANEVELYQWTAAAGATPAQVTCVSCGVAAGAGVQTGGVLVSPNGQYVYFSSGLAAGGNGLFVAHDGSVVPIASNTDGYQLANPSQTQVSPAGDVIVFSDVDLQGPTGGSPLYLSDITGGSATTPVCITCDAAGTAGLGILSLSGSGLGSATADRGASTLAGGDDEAITADGDTVVFETPNALGTATDSPQIYEWTPSGGDQFIADGDEATTDSGDAAITPDGQDIFFYSSDELTAGVAQPETIALYDARVGGGFAAPPPAASCSGDSCQGASPGSSPPTVGSTGACCGNVSGAVTSSEVSVSHPTARARDAAARDGRLTISVRVRGTGTLIVRLVGRVAGRDRQVAVGTRRLITDAGGRARTVTITLRLSPIGRKALVEGARLSLTMTATFPGARASRSTITLTGPPRRRSASGRQTRHGGRS